MNGWLCALLYEGCDHNLPELVKSLGPGLLHFTTSACCCWGQVQAIWPRLVVMGHAGCPPLKLGAGGQLLPRPFRPYNEPSFGTICNNNNLDQLFAAECRSYQVSHGLYTHFRSAGQPSRLVHKAAKGPIQGLALFWRFPRSAGDPTSACTNEITISAGLDMPGQIGPTRRLEPSASSWQKLPELGLAHLQLKGKPIVWRCQEVREGAMGPKGKRQSSAVQGCELSSSERASGKRAPPGSNRRPVDLQSTALPLS